MHEHFDLIPNPFKYNVRLANSISKKIDECKMQLMSNGLNIFKMNDPSHVQMLIVQEMQKNSLIYLNINGEALNCYMCFNINQ
jgi:hypothetical protein